jgi:hypothetical protein
MILRILLASLLGAAQTYAQQFWFSDGAGLELHTETTGQTAVVGGGMISWDEVSRTDRVSRFVRDSQDKTIFAYELEAHRADEPGAINILIRPFTGAPTVSREREFKAVRYGQEVQLEILANPKTGERVYDVLRPIEGPSPNPGRLGIQAVSIPRLVVDGHETAVKGSWPESQLPRLYIPGHGAFYLAWKSKPKYRLAGYLEKNRLVFLMDGEYVEMIFAGNVPAAQESGPVWIYHDPNFKSAKNGGAVCLLDSY